VAGWTSTRRATVEQGLDSVAASLPPSVRREALIVFGDPAEEAAKVVRDRGARLVVMGLHASPLLGPRIGSVTYRLLCVSSSLVLALPPERQDTALSHASVTSTPEDTSESIRRL
jgi:nucleotide-binding universal stress UspA family protein